MESVDLNYGNQNRKSSFIWGVEEDELARVKQPKSKNPNEGGTHPSRQALSMTPQRLQGGGGWKHPMNYTQLN